MNVAALNTSFRGIVRTLLALPANSVRPANQNAPTTDPNQGFDDGGFGGTPIFATVLLYQAGGQGHDNFWTKNVSGDETVEQHATGQRLLNASVQFFGPGANDYASRLQGALWIATRQVDPVTGLTQFQAAGLGLGRVGIFKDLSQVIDSLWEERSQLDVELYAVSDEFVTSPTFGTFPASAVLK